MNRQQSTRGAIDDGVITSRVKAALSSDALTTGLDIRVETIESVVELSGFVETTAVHDEALEIARHTEGVSLVNDSLDIRR